VREMTNVNTAKIALGLMLSFLFAGAARGEVTIKVYGLPDVTSPSIDSKIAKAVLDEFHKIYPYIKVTSATGLGLEGKGGGSLLVQIAGNMAPDVMYVNFSSSHTLIEQEFLYPLDEFVNDLSPQDRGVVPEKLWPIIRRKGPNGQEHIYAWPTQPVVRALFYRKDLFQEAGLPDRVPENWEELIEFSRKLTDPEKGRYGLALYGGTSLGWEWLTFLWSAGGEAVVQDKKGDWRCAFDSDEAAKAALIFAKLNRQLWERTVTDPATGRQKTKKLRGFVFSDVDPGQGWSMGRIGMRFIYLGYDYNTDIMNPDLYGIGPVPVGPTGIRGCEFNCRMMGIFSGVKDEKVRRAAWRYISFWMGRAARKARVDTLVQNGYGRFVQAELLREFGYDEYARMIPESWSRAFEESSKSGKPEPYGKNCAQVYGWMAKPLGQILSDSKVLGAMDRGDDRAALVQIKAILRHGVKTANEKMLGTVPPETQRFRTRVAMVLAAVIALAFGLSFRAIFKVFSPPEDDPVMRKGAWQFRRYKFAYLFLLPALGTIALWQYYPLIHGALMAFQDFRVTGTHRWVGLANFTEVLFDDAFWYSLWVTVKYAAICLTFGFAAPIALAITLQEIPRGKILYRTIFYLPAVTTGLVVIFLWKGFYQPDGLLNQILGFIGIESDTAWLESSWALVCCVLPVIWAGMGPGSLIYLAALKTIPDDLYEAANIDGAGIWRRVIHITLPSIRELVIINFIGAFIGAFQTAEFILAMTGGGPYRPYGQTEAIGLHIFSTAFFYLRFGIATAMAWILGLLLVGFTIFQLRRLRNLEFRTAKA
jgi:ABC-type sugar transport system permease subunit/ABC-type glycerol-3-phosphate transport system substrate-binding protein